MPSLHMETAGQACPGGCLLQRLPLVSRSQQAGQRSQRIQHAESRGCTHSSRPQRRHRGSLLIRAAVKVTTEKNVVCSKTLVGKPGQEKTLHRLCQDITKFSQQRMSDRQSGILSFECSQDNWEPNVVHFWERYVGNAKLGAHSTSPEMKKFMEKVRAVMGTASVLQPGAWTFQIHMWHAGISCQVQSPCHNAAANSTAPARAMFMAHWPGFIHEAV